MNSPFVFVIFGATGDLARHKLFPALLSLFKQKKLAEKFYIVGFSRRDLDDEQFRAFVKAELKDGTDWDEFAKNLYYQKGLFDEEEGYQELIKRLGGFDEEMGACITRLFYLATPPNNYEEILDKLSSTKLSEGCGQGSNKWTKVAIEKPFGKDLETARALDKKLSEIFEERQIFRVDHYLGKETVQNMIAFRFANGIFEPIWNNQYVDHVQITFSESKGIDGRGAFFDGVGELLDVAQNHLLQLLTTVTMEQPKSFSKEGVRDARAAAMKAIRCSTDLENVTARGQYEGYLSEKNVAPNSITETFVAMKVFVDTPRFSGVPFYLRAGKGMEKDVVEINIVFVQTCHILFKEFGCPEIGNVLTIKIQPDEGIRLRVVAKKPGTEVQLGTVDMKFSYAEEFGQMGTDAYEKLLLDIFAGDQMLFNRSDELESSWAFITDVLHTFEKENKAGKTVQVYKKGSWGPSRAEELIEKDGRKWI